MAEDAIQQQLLAPRLLPTQQPYHPPPKIWTFTHGFVLGQATFFLTLLVFIRYVVFSPAEPQDDESSRRQRAERRKRAKLSTTAVPAPPPHHILDKVDYDMSSHPAETSDWVNVLFAQIMQGYRNDLLAQAGEEGARQRIEKRLNPEGSKLSWLDPIEVTSLQLGAAYPILSSARMRPADGQGHIRAEVEIEYVDNVSLTLSTSVLVNIPRPRFGVLPVTIGVELGSIDGTLSIEIHDPPGSTQQHVHVSLLPDFNLNLKTTTLLGSRAKLQDVPKLEQLIVSRLRSALQDRVVYPHHLSFALPRLLAISSESEPSSPGTLAPDSASATNHEAALKPITKVNQYTGGPTVSSDEDIPLHPHTIQRTDSDESSFLSPTFPSSSPVRKLPIPAAYPGATPTTGGTPVQHTPSRPQHQQSYRFPSAPSAVSSTRPLHIPPNDADSQFRFRGQFASRPVASGDPYRS